MIEDKLFKSINRPGEYLKYVEILPKTNPDEKLPLFIYIHGAGGRGDDLEVLHSLFITKIMDNRESPKTVYIAPQCHCDTWFELFDVLIEYIEDYVKKPYVDPDRVYIAGSSMGGYTTWQLIMSRPEIFAAAVPICGGGMYWNSPRIVNIPIWAFHGALDPVVRPEESIKMVGTINSCGGNARITIFPHASHNAWEPALNSPETWEWIYAQKRNNKNE